jgi:hypothetical protein
VSLRQHRDATLRSWLEAAAAAAAAVPPVTLPPGVVTSGTLLHPNDPYSGLGAGEPPDTWKIVFQQTAAVPATLDQIAITPDLLGGVTDATLVGIGVAVVPSLIGSAKEDGTAGVALKLQPDTALVGMLPLDVNAAPIDWTNPLVLDSTRRLLITYTPEEASGQVGDDPSTYSSPTVELQSLWANPAALTFTGLNSAVSDRLIHDVVVSLSFRLASTQATTVPAGVL